MLGKLVDAALRAPGEIAKAAAETVVRLPGAPLDVVNGIVDGAGRGVGKLTDSRRAT